MSELGGDDILPLQKNPSLYKPVLLADWRDGVHNQGADAARPRLTLVRSFIVLSVKHAFLTPLTFDNNEIDVSVRLNLSFRELRALSIISLNGQDRLKEIISQNGLQILGRMRDRRYEIYFRQVVPA